MNHSILSKKQFVSYIDQLEELSNIESNINEAFKELSPDFNMLCFGKYTSIVTGVLHDVFKDKSDWIGYFIYEKNFGHDSKLGDVVENGKKIPLNTPDDLYDMLIKNLASKQR